MRKNELAMRLGAVMIAIAGADALAEEPLNARNLPAYVSVPSQRITSATVVAKSAHEPLEEVIFRAVGKDFT